jgi:hypothetical protein
LNKKKQKFKAKDQPPFAPQNLVRMAVRSLSPKPAALLPTYGKFQEKLIQKKFIYQRHLRNLRETYYHTSKTRYNKYT